MRIVTVFSAALVFTLAGCSSQDNIESTSSRGSYAFDYGPTVDTPTIEHVIHFEEGNATLSDDAKRYLEPHIQHLISKPWLGINVQGSSSKTGSFSANYDLGLKRAAAVRGHLIAQGVDETQVTVTSVGEIDVPGFENRTVVLSY